MWFCVLSLAREPTSAVYGLDHGNRVSSYQIVLRLAKLKPAFIEISTEAAKFLVIVALSHIHSLE